MNTNHVLLVLVVAVGCSTDYRDSDLDLNMDAVHDLNTNKDTDGDVCIPVCDGWACGGDGCGGLCGECRDNEWCKSGRCVECVPTEWKNVRGGAMNMGADDLTESTQPVHVVTVSSFEMSRTEATVCQYKACQKEGICSTPDIPVAGSDYPVMYVTWQDVNTFCHWAGGRMCSESEWEYAARNGDKEDLYPWGDQQPSCELAVFGMDAQDLLCSNSPQAVCSRTVGTNEWGICDLGGNVSEWVQDWYHDDYTNSPDDGTAWLEPVTTVRVVRGGDFESIWSELRASHRRPAPPDSFQAGLGIRCCRNVK